MYKKTNKVILILLIITIIAIVVMGYFLYSVNNEKNELISKTENLEVERNEFISKNKRLENEIEKIQDSLNQLGTQIRYDTLINTWTVRNGQPEYRGALKLNEDGTFIDTMGTYKYYHEEPIFQQDEWWANDVEYHREGRYIVSKDIITLYYDTEKSTQYRYDSQKESNIENDLETLEVKHKLKDGEEILEYTRNNNTYELVIYEE